MRIGIDFDNTIISYDKLFHSIACERNLIPSNLPKNKTHIRDFIRKNSGEHDWILLQGIAYGSKIRDGIPFPGVINFFDLANKKNHEIFIISHKTQYPHLGDHIDLRKSALNWLVENKLVHDREVLNKNLFFLNEREEKIEKINWCKCDFFIDDLPDFLSMSGFSEETQLCLFDPSNNYQSLYKGIRFASWQHAKECILEK